jgi:hypothetical protein
MDFKQKETKITNMKLEMLLEKIAPLPWRMDGNHIMDRDGNTIAVCAEGWSDDKANALYLLHAANTLPGLMDKAGRFFFHPTDGNAKELNKALEIAGDVSD